MRIHSLWLCLLSIVPLGTSAGQQTIVGVAFDSLRSQSPIVNGEVILVGTGLRTRTDSAGRFTFRNVDASARGLTFWEPWLDSLGLPALRAALPSAKDRGEIVVLSTPSLATYQRAVCGTALGDGGGILLGETRSPAGEPRGGTVVAALWTQTVIGVGRLEESLIATMDTTSAAGIFTLCGVPIGTAVSVRAVGDSWAGGERVVDIAAHVQRHDLIVGSDDVLTRVIGRVVSLNGAAMPSATVNMRGESAQSVVTDASGLFELAAVARRSSDLVVRAVGHASKAIALDPLSDALDVGTIVLEPQPPELAPVRVTAGPFERERLEFERRSQGALGDFITDDMLKRIPDISANVVASMAPRLVAQQAEGPGKPTLMLRRGFGFCRPRFFSDGQDVGRLYGKGQHEEVEQWNLLQRAKRIEVYTANQAPPKFNDFDGCGVVVVWTR